MPTIRLKENEPFEVAMRRFKRTIEKTGARTRAMERKLRSVEQLSDEESVAVLGAGARAAAPALGRLVHDVLLWATVAAVSVSMAAIGGYIAWSALRGRRSGANSARAIPQDGPRSAGRSGLASHDHQRRGQ